MSKNDNDNESWQTAKLWIIWILVFLFIWLVFGRGGNSDDYEEAPDYCDVALCK
jgi:hypothetical protein